ncbi:MAG: hypothetical protein ACI35S_00470 [Anaeroplasma sp.]
MFFNKIITFNDCISCINYSNLELVKNLKFIMHCIAEDKFNLKTIDHGFCDNGSVAYQIYSGRKIDILRFYNWCSKYIYKENNKERFKTFKFILKKRA